MPTHNLILKIESKNRQRSKSALKSAIILKVIRVFRLVKFTEASSGKKFILLSVNFQFTERASGF